jgi:chromosomal replication initiator protein
MIGSASAANPWDGFLDGEENALAKAGVIALARGDEAGVSPLIVHGPSGSGKSRLMGGLVAERIARFPGSSVAILPAEAFASLCAEAAGTRGGFGDLRERFRELDLFILDDLHALERAPLALAELAHTIDALDANGAMVAATAKMGPARWSGWPDRLVSRLVGGLSVRVDLPGLESRRRYLLDRARSRGLRLSSSAVEAMAEEAPDYRALDGLLARVALDGRVGNRALDVDLVGEILSEGGPSPGDAASAEKIARVVAARFGVTLRDLRSSSRRQALVVPRHLAIWLVRRSTGLSFAAIGSFFGHRDAATIRHACRAAQERLAKDPAMAAEVGAMGM